MITFTVSINSMRDFPAWGDGKKVLDQVIKKNRIDELDEYMEMLYMDNTPSEEEINEFLHHDLDTIDEWKNLWGADEKNITLYRDIDDTKVVIEPDGSYTFWTNGGKTKGAQNRSLKGQQGAVEELMALGYQPVEGDSEPEVTDESVVLKDDEGVPTAQQLQDKIDDIESDMGLSFGEKNRIIGGLIAKAKELGYNGVGSMYYTPTEEEPEETRGKDIDTMDILNVLPDYQVNFVTVLSKNGKNYLALQLGNVHPETSEFIPSKDKEVYEKALNNLKQKYPDEDIQITSRQYKWAPEIAPEWLLCVPTTDEPLDDDDFDEAVKEEAPAEESDDEAIKQWRIPNPLGIDTIFVGTKKAAEALCKKYGITPEEVQ